MKANQEIRDYAKSKKVSLWQVADVFNVHETTFLRYLRKEFTEERKGEIRKIIDKIALEN